MDLYSVKSPRVEAVIEELKQEGFQAQPLEESLIEVEAGKGDKAERLIKKVDPTARKMRH